MHYLHSKGVIYCDLKPSNVLLNEYGTLKYCDFGLARRIVDLIQTDEEVIDYFIIFSFAKFSQVKKELFEYEKIKIRVLHISAMIHIFLFIQ